MTHQKLSVILGRHRRWLQDRIDGERADLTGADLYKADLWEANLGEANLQKTNLSEADLARADLQEANLREANLSGADLCYANLCGADLSYADLSGADLRGTDLRETDLSKADLQGTVLDPYREPNGQVDAFQWEGDYCIGYRTRHSQHVPGHEYVPGQTYTAPVFSTCPETECHPGLYVCATLEEVQRAYPEKEYVRVLFLPHEAHTVEKTRCKAFYKVETVP